MDALATIKKFSQLPIEFKYESPSQALLRELSQDQNLTVLENSDRLLLDQTYFKLNLSGASPSTFTRTAVARRLNEALTLLGNTYEILVFDCFRSRQTQKALFDFVANKISASQPNLSANEVYHQTRKYIVHPDDSAAFPVPPHNSGGAIDLALCKNKQLLPFGTEFDNPSIMSSTTFFESEFRPQYSFSEKEWLEIRQNRRILFHTLISLGFTNYQEEWWHYDLGDCMWAQEHRISPIFSSLETEVENYNRNK